MAIRTPNGFCGNCFKNKLVQADVINEANGKLETYVCENCKYINHDRHKY